MEKCGAIFKLSHKENPYDCIFECQLKEGHKGKHIEKHKDYTITWKEDERVTCELCSKLINIDEIAFMCPICNKRLCKDCISGDRIKVYQACKDHTEEEINDYLYSRL